MMLLQLIDYMIACLWKDYPFTLAPWSYNISWGSWAGEQLMRPCDCMCPFEDLSDQTICKDHIHTLLVKVEQAVSHERKIPVSQGKYNFITTKVPRSTEKPFLNK